MKYSAYTTNDATAGNTTIDEIHAAMDLAKRSMNAYRTGRDLMFADYRNKGFVMFADDDNFGGETWVVDPRIIAQVREALTVNHLPMPFPGYSLTAVRIMEVSKYMSSLIQSGKSIPDAVFHHIASVCIPNIPRPRIIQEPKP